MAANSLEAGQTVFRTREQACRVEMLRASGARVPVEGWLSMPTGVSLRSKRRSLDEIRILNRQAVR